MKTYTELCQLGSFIDRFNYLKLNGQVGDETFGCDRYINQIFYRSKEWRQFRRDMIIRDGGFDLGVSDRPIGGTVTLHHLNPITMDDIVRRDPKLLDPENVICVSDITHKAIHYGDENLLLSEPITRKPNDTVPWK